MQGRIASSVRVFLFLRLSIIRLNTTIKTLRLGDSLKDAGDPGISVGDCFKIAGQQDFGS